MDNNDDLCSQWPAWKFGMKREDLFTKLHDRYNTVPSSIQDPEAFHHDVYEISTEADSPAEFHRLLADRKALRLRELNQSLESAAVEIIANPELIGTDQWQHAIQLFRTRSLDSIVRYYSSYLPDEHPWSTSSQAPAAGAAVPVDNCYIFDSSDEDIYDRVTFEPKHLTTDIPASHMPLSPRSSTMSSDLSGSALSPIDLSDTELAFDIPTPSRTVSCSETDNDLEFSATLTAYDEEEDFSQADDHFSPPTSVSDYEETQSLPDTTASYTDEEAPSMSSFTPAACDETDDGGSESETPTPRKEASTESYLSCRSSAGTTKLAPLSTSSTMMQRSRSASSLYTAVLAEYVRGARRTQRDISPGGFAHRRRSPETGRVQKPSAEFSAQRPKYHRKRVD